ncbi:MAG: NADH-quinone oxidoreductase subunit C [Armatimonadetes bacterium]|nr:NADH-quinone oxidoreductase subunit C [Armatimonadota bacterium]
MEKKKISLKCLNANFLETISRIKVLGASLMSISVHPREEEMGLTYFFDLGGVIYEVSTATNQKTIHSLYSLFNNADFIERECNLLFNIKFLGHPNLSIK